MSRRAIPGPEQHIDVDRPGELVGIDCFYVGRLQGTKGAIWQLTAIDIASSFAWAELVDLPSKRNPTAARPASSPAASPASCKAAGWQLERVLSDNGNEFTAATSATTVAELERPPHPHPRRPPADQRPRRSAPQDDPRRVLATRVRPLPLPPLHAASAASSTPTSRFYNHDRVHHGRLTRGRIPADIVYGARKMEAR